MNSASSAVENGMNTTASRNTRWIHVSRWSLRAKKLSWVCWPAQKMPSVKKLIRYVSRCGPNGTSAFQTVASDARAPGARFCPEKCWYRRTSYAGSAAPGATDAVDRASRVTNPTLQQLEARIATLPADATKHDMEAGFEVMAQWIQTLDRSRRAQVRFHSLLRITSRRGSLPQPSAQHRRLSSGIQDRENR